jgi:hypothetical protein
VGWSSTHCTKTWFSGLINALHGLVPKSFTLQFKDLTRLERASVGEGNARSLTHLETQFAAAIKNANFERMSVTRCELSQPIEQIGLLLTIIRGLPRTTIQRTPSQILPARCFTFMTSLTNVIGVNVAVGATSSLKSMKWTMLPSCWLELECQYRCRRVEIYQIFGFAPVFRVTSLYGPSGSSQLGLPMCWPVNASVGTLINSESRSTVLRRQNLTILGV